MKSFPIKKILILVTILAVPGFLYNILQDQGKNRYKPLPIFGPKMVASTVRSVRGKQVPDTIYHNVGDFKLINQVGDTLTAGDYEGKIKVVNLFYTKGNTEAVQLTMKAMKALASAYDRNKVVSFISLTIDPENDTLEVLKSYAAGLSARAGKWDLLSGDSTTIYKLINKGLFVDVHQVNTTTERKFVYSNMFVLLDYKNHIRGYYEATSQEDLSRLDDEIKVSILEELRNNNDGR